MAKALNPFARNQQIEAFLAERDGNGGTYSAEDIAYLQGYEGSGGQGSRGATGEGLLYEFYTPDFVVDLMWEAARAYGYDEAGTVLEPSCATGRLFRPAPDYRRCVGFEINPVSARIAEVSFPGCTVHRGYFETAFLQAPRFTVRPKQPFTWLAQYPFSLVIGNPPYGIYKNKYAAYFPEGKQGRQIENFFMLMGLRLLKKDGLLIYLTSSNFLRNADSYRWVKSEMGKLGTFVDAYRLPPVFKSSQVPTDILIFRRQ